MAEFNNIEVKLKEGEKMGNEIIKVLDSLSEKFGVAVDWSQQNILPYIQEIGDKIVKYTIMKDWAGIAVCSLISVLLVVIFTKWFKYGKKNYEFIGGWDCYIIASIFGGIGLFVSFACIIGFVLELIACYTFPEKIILEYIQQLIQTS